MRRQRKEVIKLGKLEGADCSQLKWKSKNKALSWNFACYMPVLMRDVLRELASNLNGCPGWFAEGYDDIDTACTEWSKKLNQIADKLDYASKIDNALDFLSEEDQEVFHKWFSKDDLVVVETDEDKNVHHVLAPVPDYIRKIWDKEDEVREDMQNKLKEALQELGEIWYNLWD